MRHPLRSALLTTSVLVIGCLAVADVGFVTADDPMMMLIAAGPMSGGDPSSYVVFSNQLWGLVLAALYRFSDGVAWYTYALVGVHVAAAFVLTWCLYRSATGLALWCPLLLIWLGFELRFLVNLQFTHAAGAAAAAGLCALVAGAVDGHRPLVLSGSLLACLGFLVRPEAFLLVAGVLLPVCAWAAWRHRLARVGLIAVVLLVAAAGSFDAWSHRSSEGWQDHGRLLSLMSGIIDGPLVTIRVADDGAEVQAALDEVGWTTSEWLLLKRHRFPQDPEVFGASEMSRVVQRLATTRTLSEMGGLAMAQLADFAFLPMLALLASVPLLVHRCPGRTAYVVVAGLTLCFAAGSLGYLLWAERLPAWVRMIWVHGLAAPIVLAAARCSAGTERRRRLTGPVLLLLLATGLAVALAGILLLRDHTTNQRDRANHGEIERALFDDDGLYLLNNLEYFRTFDPWTTPKEVSVRFLPAAGLMRSPHVAAGLRTVGETMLWPAIVERKVTLIGKREFLAALCEHLSRHEPGRYRAVIRSTYGPPPNDGRDRQFHTAICDAD